MSEPILLDPAPLIQTDMAVRPGYGTRYNGGWTKTVTGLDKTQVTGYSILGEFMRKGRALYQVDGLYLDCGIGGSRARQYRYYTLFRVRADGTLDILATTENQREWATDLWPAIEAALGAAEGTATGR